MELADLVFPALAGGILGGLIFILSVLDKD